MAERKRVYEARDDIRRTLISDDETPDRFVTQTEQDVEPILDGIAAISETDAAWHEQTRRAPAAVHR